MTPLRHRDYRVETRGADAWVRVRGGVIVDCAPIYRRLWLGRPFAQMKREAVEVTEITDAQEAE